MLVFCRVLWSFSTSIVYPFLSLYILALGGTPAQIGLINSLGILSGMVLYPVGGYVADRIGRVRLVGFSTYAYALCHLFFVFAKNWQSIAVGQFLSQLFLFYIPAMNALQADSLPPFVRGRGFATIMAIPNSVRIIAPYIGGWIIAAFGGGDAGMIKAIRLYWSVALVTGLVVATIRLKFLKETVPDEERDNDFSLRKISHIIRDSYLSIFESVKWMGRSLQSIILIEVVSALFVAMSAPFWIVYAKQVVGLTPYDWGIVLLISGLVGIVLAFPLGSLVDRVGPRRVILLSMGLAPPTVFLYQYAGGFAGVLIIICFISVINGMMMPAFSTLIANMIPRNRRGRLYSLLGERGITFSFGNFWGGGFMIFPAAAAGSFMGGYIYEMNKAYLWIILPIATLANLALAIKYLREPENAQR